jgi:DNA replication ATP-dependent helicase Dna2
LAVYLYDDWYQTDVRERDVFNVIGAFTAVPPSVACSSSAPAPTRSIVVTAQANLLIMHPDLLLTATALSTAPQCTRRPLLSGMVRSSTDITPALVWGNMLHEVMQRCLKDDKWNEVFLTQCIDRAVQGRLGDLVKIGVTEETAKREVLDRSRGLQVFAEKYLSQKPKVSMSTTLRNS